MMINMNTRLPHQVHAAYHTSMMQGLRSEEIWIASLEYVVKKLHSAKQARTEGRFEEAFHHHQRILAVIAVLRAHADGSEGPVPAEHAAASAGLVTFYDSVRDMLSHISARADAARRYDYMVGQTQNLTQRLRMAFTPDLTDLTPKYPQNS